MCKYVEIHYRNHVAPDAMHISAQILHDATEIFEGDGLFAPLVYPTLLKLQDHLRQYSVT